MDQTRGLSPFISLEFVSMSIFGDNITNKLPQEILGEIMKDWIDKNFPNRWNTHQGNLTEIEKAFNSYFVRRDVREMCEGYHVYSPWMILQPVVDETMLGKILIVVMYFSEGIDNLKNTQRTVLLKYKIPFPSSNF